MGLRRRLPWWVALFALFVRARSALPPRVRAATLAAVLASVLAAAGAGAQTPPPGASGAAARADTEQAMLAQANRFRRDQGLAPLRAEPRLQAAARDFAAFMARSGRYGHEADGRDPAQRIAASGYRWCRVAENIAWQYNSAGFAQDELARLFVQGWIDSPGHRDNLLDGGVADTGVAVAQADGGRWYAVQLFARGEPCAPRR